MQSVAALLEDAGTITYRKMFGEYCVYCDGKLFGCVCDDRLLVKITEPGKSLYAGWQAGIALRGESRCSGSSGWKTGPF